MEKTLKCSTLWRVGIVIKKTLPTEIQTIRILLTQREDKQLHKIDKEQEQQELHQQLLAQEA